VTHVSPSIPDFETHTQRFVESLPTLTPGEDLVSFDMRHLTELVDNGTYLRLAARVAVRGLQTQLNRELEAPVTRQLREIRREAFFETYGGLYCEFNDGSTVPVTRTVLRCPLAREAVNVVAKNKMEEMPKQGVELSERAKLLTLRSAADLALVTNQVRTLPHAIAKNADLVREMLGLWGRSRDQYENDNHGRGFNAGTVHYLLYRLSPEKAARWQPLLRSEWPGLSVEHFADFTRRSSDIIQNPRTGKYIIVGDNEGNERTMVLQMRNGRELFYVGNRRSGETHTKIVTVLPWKRHSAFHNEITRILTDPLADAKRLNKLGSNVHTVRVDDDTNANIPHPLTA
jgi:hypothetical protein